jgi:hypothetical protein
VGAVGGAAGAAVYTGGFASGALPQFIKSAYVDGLKKGMWKDPEDFARRTAGILWDTSKAGVVNMATMAVGGKVGASLANAKTAINPFAQLGIKTAAELATMTTVSAGLNGHLPTKEDMIDGAALLAFLHVASKGAGATSKIVSNARDNLANHWRDTDQHPTQAAMEAVNNPWLRAKMQNAPEPTVRPASAVHPSPSGPFVIQRNPGAFDDEVKFMIDKQEGGARITSDTGGVTKYGISHKANPDLDVKNLTREQAQEVLHERYYKPVGAYRIKDPQLRLAAFDSAVNEGVGTTKAWLKEAGGDLQKFMALRAQKYAKLLESQPDKYGKYEASWNARMKRLGADGTIRDIGAAPPGGEGGLPPEEPPAKPPGPDFSGDPWGAIRHTMTDFDEPTTNFGDFLKEKAHRVYLEMFNPEHPIQKLQATVEQGAPLPDDLNPRFLYRLSELSNTKSQYMVERNMVDMEGNVTGPGLKGIIGDFKPDELRDFLVYGKARWAQEKADQAKETGVHADAARAVAEQGKARFEEKFKQLVDWQNGTLKYLRDGGVLSAKAYEESVKQNAARIPGYRVDEDATNGVGGAGKGKTAFNPIRKFLGSDKKTQPILESLLKEAFLRVELANRNRANAALAEIAEPLGLAHRDPAPPMKIVLTDAELMKAGVDVGALDEQGEGMAIYRRLATGLRDDQVPILKDGKMTAYTFVDPEVTRFLRGLDTISLSTWQRMAAGVTKVTRSLIVMNPLFPVHLMQYDIPWQFITKPGFRNTIADVAVGLRHVVGNSPAYDAWLRSGGAERVFQGLSKNEYIKDVMKGQEDPSFTDGVWNALNTPYHALRAWGQLLNQAQRVGRFARGQEAGEDLMRAGVASSEAAFHRAGFGGPGAKIMNAVSPFFNAYLNSLEQTVRGQLGIGKTITGEKFNPAQFTMKAMAVITLPMLANWYISKDEEWYKAAPDWQKDNGLLFRVNDNTLFLKYPPLVSELYGGMMRRLVAAFVEDNPHELDGMSKSFGAALLPGGGLISYNVFLPIIEHLANHSFFKDHPLVPDDVRRTTGTPEQFNLYSSDAAKKLSRFVNDLPLLKGMNLSPPVIDNYIQGWGGTLGEAAVRGSELAYHTAKGDKPAATLSELPLLSSFFSRYPSASAKPILEYQERMDKFNQVHGSLVRSMTEGDLARFTALAKENPTAAMLHAFKLKDTPVPGNVQQFGDALTQASAGANQTAARDLLMTDKALKNLRTYVKFVYANESFTPRDKRQMLDQAYGQMQVIAERGLTAFDALEKSKPVPELPSFQPMRPPVNVQHSAVPIAPPGEHRGEVPVA